MKEGTAIIPLRLQREEFRFLLIPRGEKKAFEEDWPRTANYRFNDPKLLAYLKSGGNYGVVGGFGDLVILDADNEETKEAIEKGLPGTFTVRTGRGGNHYYYLSDLTEAIRLYDENGKNVGDIQGTGKQVVGAGSLHPNGNRYKILHDREIARITAEELREVVKSWLVKSRAKEKYPDKDWEPLDTIGILDVISAPKLTQRGDELQGPHPIHGSTGGQNFCVNLRKNVWHCFRHGSGGGPLEWLAVEHGVIDCAEAVPGALTGETFWEVVKIAEKEIPGFSKAAVTKKGGKKPEKEESASAKAAKRAAKKRTENFELANSLMTEFDFLTMEDTEELWTYADGVWKPKGEIMVKMRVQDAFQDQNTIHRTREVIAHIKRDGSTIVGRDIFDSKDHLVNLENGVIDLAHNPPKLLEHDAEYHFTYKLPILFNPDAECPNIERFFQDVLKPEDVETMEEWFGYHLLRSYPYARLQVWFGVGRNGKTRMKILLEVFLGEENITSISIQDLNEDKFLRAELHGKLGNICGDLPDKPLRYTGIVKQLTGQDRMMGQRKHKDPFYFTNFGKCTFAGNELPEISDRTLAWWERLDIIEFLNIFLDGDPKTDPDIIEKLTTEEELSGLLNLALRGLQRLLKRKGFKRSRTSDETKMNYLRISAPALAFMQDCVKADDTAEIEKEYFYQAFRFYCRQHSVKQVESTGIFTGKVKQYASDIDAYVELKRATHGKPRPYVWRGISWKKNPLEEKEGFGKFDIDIIVTGSQINQMAKLKEIIKCLQEAEGFAHIEEIISMAQEKDISETKVEEFIKKWLQEGEIYAPKKDRYKLVGGKLA